MQDPDEIEILHIDPEIERTFRQRRREQRRTRVMAENQNQIQDALQNGALPVQQPPQAQPILVGDYVNPLPAPIQPPIIYPPFGQANFHIRPDVINLFQNHQDIRFSEKATENPHEHIQAFTMLCDVISHEGMSRDAFRMRLFPHTLKEGAKIWMMSQSPGSIVSWNDMVKKFTMKFFPPSRVHQIRNEVYLFRQRDFETYPEAWDRFKSAFRKCPNLNIPKLAQIYLFYNGLRSEFRNIVDASAGGSILTIEVDDAHNLFERIAENQANWPTDREAPRKAAGMHNIDSVTALAAQMEAITKKLDTLTQSVNMVQTPTPMCAGCGADHITTSCPLASTHTNQTTEVSYAQNYQRQNGPYLYNYHPSLNKHPNYA